MRELALVQFVDGLIERFQQLEPLRRNARFHDAAVLFLPLARDQNSLLHAIKKTRHVGVVRNHAFGDAAAGKPFRFGAAQNAQRVVLRRRQIIGFQKLLDLLPEAVGGLLECDEGVGLEGSGRLARA